MRRLPFACFLSFALHGQLPTQTPAPAIVPPSRQPPAPFGVVKSTGFTASGRHASGSTVRAATTAEPPLARFGRMVGSVPHAQREQLAIHSATRELIELAALFESDPTTGATDRRVTHFADGSGDVHLVIDAVRESRTLRDALVKDRRARVVRDPDRDARVLHSGAICRPRSTRTRGRARDDHRRPAGRSRVAPCIRDARHAGVAGNAGIR